MERLARSIRAARKARGLTQQELADRLGIDQGHISRVERGQKGATIDVISAIAAELGVSVAYLFGEGGAGRESQGLEEEAVMLARLWQGLPHRQREAVKVIVYAVAHVPSQGKGEAA